MSHFLNNELIKKKKIFRSRLTPDEIIKLFRRPKQKTPAKSLIDVLKQITNNIPYAVGYIEEFHKNSNKLVFFLNFVSPFCVVIYIFFVIGRIHTTISLNS